MITAGFTGVVNRIRFRMATVAVLVFAVFFLGMVSAAAQSQRRQRRESTANRKARIARTIAETYGHTWEAAGGGGYLRFRSGQYLQQNNEVTFWASTRYNVGPKLGVLGEVRGAYGKAKIGNTIYDIANPQISEYAFMAGPSYRFIKAEKFGVSGFAEGGLGLGKFAGGSKGFSAADIGVWTGDYGAAFTAGLNLDYNFDPSLSVRVTPNYLGTTFGGTLQNSKGFNIGVVYRFGKNK
jgi:hypothetical protein